jgi:Na+-translocating ferredoxin:NAD+ oxidoreductase RnfD subunit
MATRTMTQASPLRAARRFIRSSKGTLLIILAIITAIAAPREGLALVAPSIVSAMLAAAAVDVALSDFLRGELIFPDGALLTGLIIALIESPDVPAWVPPATAALAIASKYLLRTRWSNVFNPAALALVAATLVFRVGQSWWGAFPDLPPVAIVALIALGVFLAARINKLPMALVFLGAYFTLFTVAAFFGDPARVAEIYRAPDVNAAIFFGFFMLDDPPTSPVKYDDQVWYGLIVAVVGFAVFETLGVVYFLLAGVMVGNLWESWRRLMVFAESRARSDRS